MDQPKLSPSETRTLREVASAELHATELDWVALHRLKRLGLVEELAAGPALTKEGQQTLGRLSSPSSS